MNFDMHGVYDVGLYFAHGRWYNQDTGLWLSPWDVGDYLYGGHGQDPVDVGWIDTNDPWWCTANYDYECIPSYLNPVVPPTPSPQPGGTIPPSGTMTPTEVLRGRTPTVTLTPPVVGDESYRLAKMMWYEERGEGTDAMQVVGFIMLNRVSQPKEDLSNQSWPGSIREVLNTGETAGGDGDADPWKMNLTGPDLAAWRSALIMAPEIIARRLYDPSEGRKWFSNDRRDNFAAVPTMAKCKEFWNTHGVVFESSRVTNQSNPLYTHNRTVRGCAVFQTPTPPPTPK